MPNGTLGVEVKKYRWCNGGMAGIANDTMDSLVCQCNGALTRSRKVFKN